MANEKRLVTEFRNELMSEFIRLCKGNDFGKLTLLKAGDVIERLYEKYSTIPTVDAAPVVRCKDCEKWHTPDCIMSDGLMEAEDNDFCSYGERRAET